MKVRCNNCMEIFDEEDIMLINLNGNEVCPCCGRSGCIADIEKE